MVSICKNKMIFLNSEIVSSSHTILTLVTIVEKMYQRKHIKIAQPSLTSYQSHPARWVVCYYVVWMTSCQSHPARWVVCCYVVWMTSCQCHPGRWVVYYYVVWMTSCQSHTARWVVCYYVIMAGWIFLLYMFSIFLQKNQKYFFFLKRTPTTRRMEFVSYTTHRTNYFIMIVMMSALH